MAAAKKVGHVGKRPTSLDGGLRSVSQISMAIRNVEQIMNRLLMASPVPSLNPSLDQSEPDFIQVTKFVT